METKTLKKTVAFAYFADGEFLGWYADSFGSVRKSPKLYNDSDKQLKVIEDNFLSKLNKVNKTSFDEQKEKVKGLGAIGLFVFDSEALLRGKNVDLRIVECPYYEGQTQEFAEFYKNKEFNPDLKWDSDKPTYVYADYDKVREWALDEPTEFLGKFEYKLK